MVDGMPTRYSFFDLEIRIVDMGCTCESAFPEAVQVDGMPPRYSFLDLNRLWFDEWAFVS
jgi:hypothetical protein